MRYYKNINDDGKLVQIGTGNGGTEISKNEYDALLSEIREKAELTDKLYFEEITADDIKPEWREEIVQRVADRIETEGLPEDDISIEKRVADLEKTVVNNE